MVTVRLLIYCDDCVITELTTAPACTGVQRRTKLKEFVSSSGRGDKPCCTVKTKSLD